MSDFIRVSKAIPLAPGRPIVPEPHPQDYSSEIPSAVFDLIDEMFQQDTSDYRVVARFEW